MTENLPHHHRLGDESDDLHRAAALRARKRQHLVDARQQKRPDVARRLAMHWLCRGRIRRDRRNRRRCGGNLSGLRQRGDRIAQARWVPAPRSSDADVCAVAESAPPAGPAIASVSVSGPRCRPGRACCSRRPDTRDRFHASVPAQRRDGRNTAADVPDHRARGPRCVPLHRPRRRRRVPTWPSPTRRPPTTARAAGPRATIFAARWPEPLRSRAHPVCWLGKKTAPPVASASNTPSTTTQWKCRWVPRSAPKRWMKTTAP